MIEIGKINTLRPLRETAAGTYLGDKDGNEILLPASLTRPNQPLAEELEVFVYTDAENRLIATQARPYAELGQFAYLRVSSVTEFGAFMDWGIEKDLFVPYSEQKQKMAENEFYVVHIHLDEKTNRLIASSRIENFVSTREVLLEPGQEVDLLVYEESPLGFSCVINGTYKGIIYHNDIYQEVFPGDELKGYVKTIRPDKLIDLSFQKSGFKNVLDATDIVLQSLHENKGFLGLHDKSSPEEISIRLSMSKATFKKAIGILYRQRQVLIKPEGVYLVQKEKEDVEKNSQ